MIKKELDNISSDVRRRRLVFRSHNRGMREMDFLLGAFSDFCMGDLTENEMVSYEALLDLPDDALFLLLVRGDSPKCDYDHAVANKIVAFIHSYTF